MRQDLRIGLQEDPDVLDPDQSRTFVGRIVYASLCDKLVDISPDLEIIPMLATGWEWNEDGTVLTMTLRDDVTFHDGEPFNAEAVAYNLDRSKNLEESRRKSEVASIESWDVVDDTTIQITLTAPDATLMAQFADRAGMMVSPKAAEEAGADFGLNPVCAGPFTFKERIAAGPHRAGEVRRLLRRGRDQLRHGHLPADPGHHRAPRQPARRRYRHARAAGGDGRRARSGPMPGSRWSRRHRSATRASRSTSAMATGRTRRSGRTSRVRQALSLAIDREALNQVVFEGAFAAGNQP